MQPIHALVPLLLVLTACSISVPPPPPAPPPPAGIPIESAVFPVVFTYNSYLDAEICRNPAELRARRDFQIEKLEQDYIVIDSAGTLFHPRRPRVLREAPGLVTRIFNGTFYTSAPVGLDFDLAPVGRVTNSEFWNAIRDRSPDPRPCGGTRDMPLPDLFRHLAAPLCVPWHHQK